MTTRRGFFAFLAGIFGGAVIAPKVGKLQPTTPQTPARTVIFDRHYSYLDPHYSYSTVMRASVGIPDEVPPEIVFSRRLPSRGEGGEAE